MSDPWYRRPLTHFLVLGVFIYLVVTALEGRPGYEVAYPGPEKIAVMQTSWLRQAGRFPDDEELALLIREELDAAILFQEALRRNLHRNDPVVYQRLLRNAEFLGVEGADRKKVQLALELGVHRGDEVIRRRLIQRMQALGRTEVAEPPADDALKQLYQANTERWHVAPRMRITHIYFSLDRGAAVALNDARRTLRQLQLAEEPQAIPLQELGDNFLHGQRLSLLDTNTLNFYFGELFTGEVLEAVTSHDAATWLGPVPSSFGYHLVRIDEHLPARQRGFDEVRGLLQEEWREKQRQASLRQFIAELRDRYEVVQ